MHFGVFMAMCVQRVMWVLMRVCMVVVMAVRHRVVMVVAAHAVLFSKAAEFAAITRHQRGGGVALQVGDALLQQLENFFLKAEVLRRDKPQRGVLGFQVVHLLGDALNQRAVEQVVRQHHHLFHAQQALALHGFFQARVGDAGEGQIHQFVVGFFHQPACHLGHIAIRLAV